MDASLEYIQSDAAALLSGDADLADVNVVEQRKGLTANEVLERLALHSDDDAKKPGACLIVLMPQLASPDGNPAGPLVDVLLTVEVIEHRLLNQSEEGTGKSAERLAAQVLRRLHHWTPRPYANCFFADRDVSLQGGVDNEGNVHYLCYFRSRANAISGLPRLSPPEIEQHGDTLRIHLPDNAPAGAAIYYTADGTYPDEDATAYSAPVAPVAAGTVIRAACYASGYESSDPIAHTFQ